MEKYSVLMSVYHKEDPEYLSAAITSMLEQTAPPDDYVIVCDGPLNEALDRVLEDFASRYPDVMQIVRLPENIGVGLAAKEGLQYCRNELVAKMDSDDLSVPDRCQRQLEEFERDPELTLLGGFIEEFDTLTGEPFALRQVSGDHEGICRHARRRCPMNNVTVMYKKSAVLAVGSYRDLRRAEDYDLFSRLLIAGYRAKNIEDVLVKVRVDPNSHRRRSGLPVLKACSSIWWNSYRKKFSSLGDLLFCMVGGVGLFLCPSFLQKLLYNSFLRKKVPKGKA